MSKIVDLLKEQKALELGHVERLQPTIDGVGHRLIAALLETVVHDSRKHAALCQALIDVEAGVAPATLDTDMATAVDLHQRIKQHTRVEEEMIGRIGAIVAEVEDDRVKEILGYILSDERRHHDALRQLSNLLDRDTAAFDEYLDLFQKYMIVPP
ncbi:MAG: ferritin-like domain-containing protein [Candidatus Bathyarchaeota archaeon]|nr:MAG: ferritin-like domain-containing protein [Candidatus Bathyarchaeota archaeon]